MNYKEIIREEINKLIDNKTLKAINYKSDGVIFNEGDECKKLGYVLKGQVIISTLSINDKEEIINIVNEDEFFGKYLIFNDSNSKYLGDVIISKNSSIVLMDKELFLNILMNNKELLHAYLTLISVDSFKTKQQVKLLSHKKNIDRVVYYLKNNSNNGTISIKSITDLSKTLNLPRENVSRIISKLIKDGHISKSNNLITINDME